MDLLSTLSEGEEFYKKLGWSVRTGFGQRPALLIIDCIHACSDPSVFPTAIAMDAEIKNIRDLLGVARAKQLPVVHTTVVYNDAQCRDGGWFVKKIPWLEALKRGSKETQIVPELLPREGELVLEKQFASAFSGTNLHSYLTRCEVDTVIVTGNSTSGCVRATVIDAVSAGFRVIIPRDCVADRIKVSHLVNLFDMDAKYGDVVDMAQVVTALQDVSGGGGPR